MRKFIPYEKLSKKEKKKANEKARSDWNGIKPATRVIPSMRAYNRAKEKQQTNRSFFLA